MEISSSGVATSVLCRAVVRCRSLLHGPMARDTCHATRPSAVSNNDPFRTSVLRLHTTDSSSSLWCYESSGRRLDENSRQCVSRVLYLGLESSAIIGRILNYSSTALRTDLLHSRQQYVVHVYIAHLVLLHTAAHRPAIHPPTPPSPQERRAGRSAHRP